MVKHITIDPVTRLEGHGKIDIFLDDNGNVERAYMVIPELRGFERFCVGRACEEMPALTAKICGVCPTAHSTAAAKALDGLYKIEPAVTGKKIRELAYNTFIFEDHMLHFFFLGGPDFIVGPDSDPSQRNIIGVINKLGLEAGKLVISTRRECRDMLTTLEGRVSYPVNQVPGGVTRGVTEEERKKFLQAAEKAKVLANAALGIFKDIVMKNEFYLSAIKDPAYDQKTYYMGLVDKDNKVNFYDGDIRVVSPDGKEFLKFPARDYLSHIEEHVEPWTYMKFPYLKKIGWKGFVDGPDSGIYRVGPLARLNVSTGFTTPEAHAEYERFVEYFSGKPVHNLFSYHWARLIEALHASERMQELLNDTSITGEDIRNIPVSVPAEGVGVVEAPRGTLYHHYKTDPKGILTDVNLVVATVNNAGAICLAVDKIAKKLITGGNVSEGILNKIETAFRVFDPCFACATHSLPGEMPLILTLHSNDGKIVKTIRRD
jgi:F420-non-reducing hydrogenase large subunit